MEGPEEIEENKAGYEGEPEKKGVFARAIARFGFWGAMAFFTIKGLLYLIVPAALTYFSCG